MDNVDLFDYIRTTSAVMTAGRVVVNMIVTVLVALFIYWVYKKTYTGVMYSKSFNVTLLLTSMVTAMVMMVIGTNLALSLGMVGALSIIRFRSAIKDPKDIGFLFWGISAGLSAGTGSYLIAVIGSLIIAVMLFIFMRRTYETYPYLLVVKGDKINEEKLRTIVKDNVIKYNLRMKSSTRAGIEVIYEIQFKDGQEDPMMEQIKAMDSISVVNIVSYKGEIAG